MLNLARDTRVSSYDELYTHVLFMFLRTVGRKNVLYTILSWAKTKMISCSYKEEL